jgi:RNA ligase
MTFIRYPHLERFGNTPVENIEFGITHIFPKLDGTNASLWREEHDGVPDFIIKGGSRNRVVTLDNDNQGFLMAILKNEKPYVDFFIDHPTYILYGEWLVPHTIKNYREDAWRRFWIFDVYDRSTGKFLPYEVYQPLLEAAGLDYIPCIKMYKNGSYDNFLHEAKNNAGFLLPEGGVPEGIVIKNYNWTNKFQEVTWAKIVLSEFKDKFHATMGANLQEVGSNAQIICDRACTETLILKEYAKITNEAGEFTSRLIPRLLHTVYYSVVTEELWDCLKHLKGGSTVNFAELKQLCILKVKTTLPQLF